jgi:hypothetical protein
MKLNRILAIVTLGILLGLLNACTWVKTTPEGESVRVASADAVSGCERKGKVTVSVKNRVSGVERKPTKVATELAALARNEGALLGGDTVVAESAVADGRQVFGVYRCAP